MLHVCYEPDAACLALSGDNFSGLCSVEARLEITTFFCLNHPMTG